MDYGVTVLNVYVTTRFVDDRILEWIGTLSCSNVLTEIGHGWICSRVLQVSRMISNARWITIRIYTCNESV